MRLGRFGADLDQGNALLEAKRAARATQTGPLQVAVAPPPTILVALPTPVAPAIPPVVTEDVVIPASDPRHPQHAQWLQMQKQSGGGVKWVAIGGGVVVILLGTFLLTRPKKA